MSDNKNTPPIEDEQDVQESAKDTQSNEQNDNSAELTEVEALQEALESAQKKADENWDIALRTKAEMENVKRRTQIDIDNARKFALEKMANELLAVHESMELGLVAAQADDANLEKIIEGSELTMKMMNSLMEKFNIVQINPEGEAFNPEHHQAISMQPSPEHENNTVISVMQKGYLLNERLLRPAMVVVAKN